MSRDFPFVHLFLSLILSCILFGLSTQNRVSLITTPINSLFKPLRSPLLVTRSDLNSSLLDLKQFPHLTRLVKDLQRQNANLNVEAQRVKELEKENEALRKQVNSPLTSKLSLLPVKVIGLSRFAYLNQGSQLGIKNDQAVIIDNIFLGVITSTSTNTSKVKLLNDKDTNLSAFTISGSTGQVIFVDTVLKLEQVLQKESLVVNEPVFTKGTDLIPDGLLIGNIIQINENPSSIYKSAIIKPALTITDQQVVFVVLDN